MSHSDGSIFAGRYDWGIGKMFCMEIPFSAKVDDATSGDLYEVANAASR
jgi:hypothetical protein